ncbi:MAG TPA: 2'-deoxycytidine 5'-triphosphate deaminase [Candidatus Nanoarchaeia archaeon]|nr:2'-deoxycytidine 5'-triphosphate deaminase [Candidatus Nanoarchaeia archaeon]
MAYRRRGGVYSDWGIEELIDKGVITNADKSLINTSSLDLRLGIKKWRLLGSILPLENQMIEDMLETTGVVDDANDQNFFMETSQPYLVKLVEGLNLPESITARIHNKSGRGRIGISTKGLIDKVPRFDFIPGGFVGDIYTEICATAFPIKYEGGNTSVPQIRFYDGEPRPLNGGEIDLLLRDYPILTIKGGRVYGDHSKREIIDSGKFTFHADLAGDFLIYKAKKDSRTIDLSKKDYYDPNEFFEEVRSHNGRKSVIIHPGEFALINSKEDIKLPPHIAAEIAEYSPDLGDLRTHYAGLINAGHGYDSVIEQNTPSKIIFEVRARDLPIMIQDWQKLVKFEVYEMYQPPQKTYMEMRSTDFSDLKSFLPSPFRKN